MKQWFKGLINQVASDKARLKEYIEKRLSRLQEERKEINIQRRQLITWFCVYLVLLISFAPKIGSSMLHNENYNKFLSAGFNSLLSVTYISSICIIVVCLIDLFKSSDLPIFSELDEKVNLIKRDNLSLNQDILEALEREQEKITIEYNKLEFERKWFKYSLYSSFGTILVYITILLTYQ